MFTHPQGQAHTNRNERRPPAFFPCVIPMPRSVSSSAATLASAAPPPAVVVASATTTTAAVGDDRRSTRSSAGPPKRRRSSRGSGAATGGVDHRPDRKETDGDEERGSPGGSASNNKWKLTPVSLLLRTLGFMDNDTLMIMCLVCQQIRDLIWSGQGMEKKLVRIFKLSASKENIDDYDDSGNDHYRVRRFIYNMNQHFQNVTKTRILQGLQHWKLQDMKEFNDRFYEDDIDDDELERVTQNIRMTGIVSLDMSSPLPSVQRYYGILYRAISFMVPNLQQLDLSHTEIRSDILENFAVRCPRLEIIRWNDNNDEGVGAKGTELDSLNTLKELYFDNCYIGFDQQRLIDENGDDIHDDGNADGDGDGDNGVSEIEAMSDSFNYPNIFLFHKLNNNPLERISLRNARYTDFDLNEGTVPQQILMKFVRKAPSTLVWFRSDLAAANIRVLQSERPGIEFLN